MGLAPVLQPAHFKGLDTQLRNGGLTFSTRLTVADWEAHATRLAYMEESNRLDQLAAGRPPGRIVLNPRTTSVDEIRQFCRTSRNQREGETFNVGYGLPKSGRFNRKWSASRDKDASVSEGQHLILAGFDAAKHFVGYAGFKVNLHRPSEWSDEYRLRVSLELVYVRPERRGQGFGLDLSIGTGRVCRDTLTACSRAVPAGSCLRTLIYADFHSEAGEAFTMQVIDEVDIAVDILRTQRKRPSIHLEHAEFEGGY